MNNRPSGVEDDEPKKGLLRAVLPSSLSHSFRRNAGLLVVALLLAGIGGARIASTHDVFSHTYDEPFNIARGMEWLANGTYTYVHHPPLAPVAAGLGPYLDGIRIEFTGNKKEDAYAILDAGGNIDRTLALARIGILPFFILATACVWWWSRRLFGDPTALVATALFTTLPPILAHSGLTTTDMAITATLALAFLAFTAWLERPTPARGAAFGVAAGLALLAKFSALVFLPAGVLAIAAVRWLGQRRGARLAPAGAGARARSLGLGALLAFVMVWGGYQFSFGSPVAFAVPWGGHPNRLSTPISTDPQPYGIIDYVFGAKGPVHDIADTVVEFGAVPAPEYVLGILSVAVQQARGNARYFLGENRGDRGSWLFFPVALGVKTPLAFLVLMFIGMYFLVRAFWSNKDWRQAVPPVIAVAILLVVLPSDVNMGVRHILPIYPLLAVVAAYGAVRLWKADKHRALTRVTAGALVAWQLVSSAAAHPDYLAYFNELAGDHPEQILVGSDLDWGQDIKRLIEELRARNIEEISVALLGPDFGHHGLPESTRKLGPDPRPTSGWIAISMSLLKWRREYSWLESYEPVTTVGRSIRLYRISPPAEIHIRAKKLSREEYRAQSPQ